MLSGDRQAVVGEAGPFVSMLRGFSRHFERIDVLVPRPARAASVLTLFDRVHFHPAPCGRAGMVGWIARHGAQVVAAQRPSLIVSHDYGWFYNGLGAARLSRASGVPYVSEIHHVPGVPVAASLRERCDRRITRAYVRWARRRARAFRVVNSAELVPLLASWGVPREQILVLPSLYIDLEVFRPEARAPEQDVLFVGRMVANKGLPNIVDALALLARKERAPRALFVGSGPLQSAVKARVERHGLAQTTRFVDWVASPAELAELYRKSRLVVCASTCEGGPRVTVEAMACGTPVVSTPVGMMKELLRDGANGFVCGFDAASLADAIERGLADEERRVRLGRAACADVQRFEYARVLGEYAAGLQGLAGARTA